MKRFQEAEDQQGGGIRGGERGGGKCEGREAEVQGARGRERGSALEEEVKRFHREAEDVQAKVSRGGGGEGRGESDWMRMCAALQLHLPPTLSTVFELFP